MNAKFNPLNGICAKQEKPERSGRLNSGFIMHMNGSSSNKPKSNVGSHLHLNNDFAYGCLPPSYRMFPTVLLYTPILHTIVLVKRTAKDYPSQTFPFPGSSRLIDTFPSPQLKY
ncbi:hypothetical protein TNCT_595151 [Trichonephila clavata]|uniref:Uncharacterized protein n=1 Tax=Trichonephila clavata TaxID=2740835 RepID=A0A8X6LJT5_TRICU|nr:hypothetical protein TNCT_595151 [Trichonephila clavata]